MNAITIESLKGKLTDEARAALAQADVIIGVDSCTQCEFTVFGTPPLESTVNFKRPMAMRLVRVLVDSGSGELEQLAALVRSMKGHDTNDEHDASPFDERDE
jgi:hypothetical protein